MKNNINGKTLYKLMTSYESNLCSQYRDNDGWVVDPNPFYEDEICDNCDSSQYCENYERCDILNNRGITFTDVDGIFKEADFYCPNAEREYIQEVYLDENEDFEILRKSKYIAPKIFLGKKMEINLDTIKYLIDQGSEINKEYIDALCWAAKHGELDIIKYLIEQNSDGENTVVVDPMSSRNAFRAACYNGKFDIAKFFMEQGNLSWFSMYRFILWAGQYKKFDLIKFFIEKGPTREIEDPLEFAIRYSKEERYLDVLKYLEHLQKGL